MNKGRTPRRGGAWIAGIALAGAALSTGLTAHRIARLRDAEPDSEVELIVLFGAKVWPSGPSPILAARIEAAAALLEARPASRVLACGDAREVAAMRDWLLKLGVAANRVVEVPAGTSTRRTWQAVHDHLPRPDSPVIAVSSRFHLHRVLAEARRQGVRATAVPHPPSSSRGPPAGALARRYGREVLAVWFYALSGSRA